MSITWNGDDGSIARIHYCLVTIWYWHYTTLAVFNIFVDSLNYQPKWQTFKAYSFNLNIIYTLQLLLKILTCALPRIRLPPHFYLHKVGTFKNRKEELFGKSHIFYLHLSAMFWSFQTCTQSWDCMFVNIVCHEWSSSNLKSFMEAPTTGGPDT